MFSSGSDRSGSTHIMPASSDCGRRMRMPAVAWDAAALRVHPICRKPVYMQIYPQLAQSTSQRTKVVARAICAPQQPLLMLAPKLCQLLQWQTWEGLQHT